jgi:hypothetical protein
VFLLNSRTPLDIATCPLQSRHPLYQRYRANLPNSLNLVVPDTPWPSQPGAPFSVLGTVALNTSCFRFHGLQASANFATILGFNLLLTFTVLQRFIPIEHADKHAWLSPKRPKTSYRYRKRIKAVQEYEPVSLSFHSDLRGNLGPTNP